MKIDIRWAVPHYTVPYLLITQLQAVYWDYTVWGDGGGGGSPAEPV